MLRNCASPVAAWLAAAMFGVLAAHPQPATFPDDCVTISVPCQPAFKTEDQSKPVPGTGPTPDAEAVQPRAYVLRKGGSGRVARAIPAPAPRTFPPLLHRPPPAHS
ncbi:MAG: hypothetical protein FJW39_08825 [Acidobacteria bacterium]|nr:hypothetical protein [Acidobacteriota bacterium]